MSYRVVNFRMVGVFLLHLLVVLLFPLAIVLTQVLQAFPPLVLFQHLVSLELIMAVFVKVLQVAGCLTHENKKMRSGIHH